MNNKVIVSSSSPNLFLTFHSARKIEENMRELGYGDVIVNKNMKLLLKVFYNILLKCENYDKLINKKKTDLFNKYLSFKNPSEKHNLIELIKYFDQFQSFCFDLPVNSVIKGDLNFKYLMD